MGAVGLNEIRLKSPSYTMRATAVFAHSTRLADSWTPLPEIVWLPARTVSEGEISISVKPDSTKSLGIPLQSRLGSKKPRRLLEYFFTRHEHINLGDRYIYDARYDTDKNIAHQLGNVICRVLLAKRKIAEALGQEVEILVILRRGAVKFAQALYAHLGIPILLTDSEVSGQLVRVNDSDVCSSQSGKMIFSGGSYASVSLIPEFLTPAKLTIAERTDLPKKIFISRKKSRTIRNEDEVAALLEANGYTKFYFEDEPYDRQVMLCRNAESIVAIHGAAMAFMLFNNKGLEKPGSDRKGLRVVELFGSGYTIDYFRRYAGVINAHWCGVRGEVTPDILRDLDEKKLARRHETSPFRVDIESLKMALSYSEGTFSEIPKVF